MPIFQDDLESKLFAVAYEFLTERARERGIGNVKALIDKHLSPKIVTKISGADGFFELFCIHAQNRLRFSAAIGGRLIGGIRCLGPVFFGFDPYRLAQAFEQSDNDIEKLLQQIDRANLLKPGKPILVKKIEGEMSYWYRYCRTVIDSAHFLKLFKDLQEFVAWAEPLAERDRIAFALTGNNVNLTLPRTIYKNIRGMRDALTCDLLKDSGLGFDFEAPSESCRDILYELKLCASEETPDVIRALTAIASKSGTTPFAVERILHIIGTGEFFQDKQKITSDEHTFIEHIKKLTGQ